MRCQSVFSEIDRTLRVRWKCKGNHHIDGQHLCSVFSKEGATHDCFVPLTKPEKEKKLKSALIVFTSIVAAHAAIHDTLDLAFKDLPQRQTPDDSPKPSTPAKTTAATSRDPELNRVPYFASFAGTLRGSPFNKSAIAQSPD
ncbi:hypothetical protein B9Z19DRAFT_1134284 [Tuber borchii]|uniref:Uncharacterized protein n=1 Tax=Tuber borchii TaxID=42251 RepID=A0A2T6ZEE4_TUBBO|nr:hypothetical protein B9Z19DRAFT_1134284 [Tuber borchii]